MEKKEIIEVNGVVLTEDAISRLQWIQKSDNDGARVSIDGITDVMVFLATKIEEFGESELPDVHIMLANLGFTVKLIRDLRKP